MRKSATVNVIMQTRDEKPTDKLLSHFWMKLRVDVAWMLNVKGASKLLVQKRKDSKEDCKQTRRYVKDNIKESITVDYLKMAEKVILAYVQKQHFPEEINMLQEGASNVKKGSSICGLDPVLDDGNLRVGGRLRRTSVREESKHPAILAKNHHVSTVILRYIHEGRNHMSSTPKNILDYKC